AARAGDDVHPLGRVGCEVERARIDDPERLFGPIAEMDRVADDLAVEVHVRFRGDGDVVEFGRRAVVHALLKPRHARRTKGARVCRAMPRMLMRRELMTFDLSSDDLTIDGLTRDWKIAQRRRGHRHSTDDLLTAWYAAEHARERSRLLDLGSGIGSVGLLVLWRSPGAVLTAIEAQEVSFALLE